MNQEPSRGGSDAVVIRDLVKKFDTVTALDHVEFSVARGELFGCIGPDGAGKTTLFRILTTLLIPDAGTATVLGYDVVDQLWDIRQRVGYMPGRFSLYPDLSVEENLRFFASVFGTTIQRGYEIIAPIYTQLEPFRARRADALSGGMKQKLALCCALVHRPDILFLDEPTTGVDAVSRREFWELLDRLKQSGLTIVVSTPYMDEANRCDRVALMQHGRVLGIDTPRGITAAFDRPLFSVHTNDRYRSLLAIRKMSNTNTIFPFGDVLHYTDTRMDLSGNDISAELTSYLEREGFSDVRVAVIPPTIEDSFMARMGHLAEASIPSGER